MPPLMRVIRFRLGLCSLLVLAICWATGSLNLSG